MRILFDHGTPAPLRKALLSHSVATAREMGWDELENGVLLRAAEIEFDVVITTDKNMRYQQNIARRRIAILVLPTTSWPKLKAHQSRISAALDELGTGEFVELRLF